MLRKMYFVENCFYSNQLFIKFTVYDFFKYIFKSKISEIFINSNTYFVCEDFFFKFSLRKNPEFVENHLKKKPKKNYFPNQMKNILNTHMYNIGDFIFILNNIYSVKFKKKNL